MMISPKTYIKEQKDKTYEELIKERDRLIKEVRYFEKKKKKEMKVQYISPSHDVIYQWNLECLSELCSLIQEKFNEKYE